MRVPYHSEVHLVSIIVKCVHLDASVVHWSLAACLFVGLRWSRRLQCSWAGHQAACVSFAAFYFQLRTRSTTRFLARHQQQSTIRERRWRRRCSFLSQSDRRIPHSIHDINGVYNFSLFRILNLHPYFDRLRPPSEPACSGLRSRAGQAPAVGRLC